MDEIAYETMAWTILAALTIGGISALFIWAPWDRMRRMRKPEEHPAE